MKNKKIQISEIWNDEKKSSLKEFITTHSQKQSKERKLRNELLSIQYRIEDLFKRSFLEVVIYNIKVFITKVKNKYGLSR